MISQNHHVLRNLPKSYRDKPWKKYCTMDYASLIDDRFLKLVGLVERIPFDIVTDLRNDDGIEIGGCAHIGKNRMEIRAGVTKNRFLAVYMHEAAHFISYTAGISGASIEWHNVYFATLVAVMYRRSNCLDCLHIYDFADNEPGCLGGGAMASDDDLIKRFRYILKRSAYYAPTPMTIEEIANDIYERDIKPQYYAPVRTRKPSKPISWLDVGIGSVLGASFVGCIGMAVAVLKFS